METGQISIDTPELFSNYSPQRGSQTTMPQVDRGLTQMVEQIKPPTLSYSEMIRLKMKTADNPTGEVLTIREAARRIGFSYEHVRKVYSGETHYVSEAFNKEICKLLGLDADAMWRVAMREKLVARFGPSTPTPSKGSRFDEIWKLLDGGEQSKVADFAEGLLMSRNASKAREAMGLASLPVSQHNGARAKKRQRR